MAPNLLNRFFKKEEQQDENFLSLILTSSEIFANIWQFEGENIKTIGFSKKGFKNLDGLIHEAASAIDSAGKLAKTDVSQVVFGLSAFWFEDGKIGKETQSILKNLSQDLDLDAQAFVPLSSSINHYLKMKDSVTPNAVFIGISHQFLEVHLAKNNQISNSKIFKSEPTVEKINSLIGQIKTETGEDLPAKIVIWGVREDSEFQKGLEKNKFKDLFLHEPKMQFMEDEDIAGAVAFSQATDILGHDPQAFGAPAANVDAATFDETINEHSKEKTQKDEPLSSKDERDLKEDELGFVEGEDILEAKAQEGDPDLLEDQPENKKENTQTEEKDSKDKEDEEFAVEINDKGKTAAEQISSPKDLYAQSDHKKENKSLIEKLTTLSYFSLLTKIFLKKTSHKNLAILTLGLFLVLGIFLFAGSQFISKADVNIRVNAKPQESTFQVTVAKNGDTNFERSQIAGEEITESVSGNQKAPTNGKKKLGEFAKGEVKVFNWTTSQVSFSKDTVIISKSGVKFSLDGEIQVASRSASTPGEKNASVTASEFGTSGNISGGSEFIFQKFDELLYSAKNDNSFTGGDEKEVTVVSQADQDKLKESLTKTLSDKAKEGLKNKLGNKKLDDSSMTVEATRTNFDKKVDEEAALLSLDMEITAKAIVYSEDELKDYLARNASSDASENLEARKENIEILSLTTKKSGNNLTLSGKYRANLTPKFDDDQLKEKIKGKGEKDARAIIKEVPQVNDVTFSFSPNIFIANSLPQDKSKINFIIEAIN